MPKRASVPNALLGKQVKTGYGAALAAFMALSFATLVTGCSDSDGSKNPGKASGGKTSTGGSTASSGGTTSSSGGKTASSGGSTATSGGSTASSGGSTASSGGTTGSTGGTTGSTGGTTGSSGGTTGSSGGTTGSTGGTTGSTGGTTGSTGGAGAPSASELVGWATEGPGTTGGGDLAPVVATSLAQLNTEAGGETAKVIHVQGKITGTVNVGSNKTIIGLTGAELSNTGAVLRLTGSKNVIIKNLKITGTHSDVNTVFLNSTNIWFDHNAVTNGKPDILRVIGSSNYVTLSWNTFKQTAFAPEHFGVNIGLLDTDTTSKGFLSVTLHHNTYQDVNERMPRVRFGKVHTFNNVCYAGTSPNTRSYYAVRSGFDANVRTERNVYKDFIGPSWWWTRDKLGNENSTVFNYARGNANSILESIEDVCLPSCIKGPIPIKEHEGVTGEGGFYSKGTAFVPPYKYVADPTDGLEAKVMAGAGPK